MKDLFFAYYPPSDSDAELLWNEGTVLLDANVLLNLYRYPLAAREDLMGLLRYMAERIVVPYQAAFEFQTNRLAVIAVQKRRFDEVRKVLNDVENKLTSDLTGLQLQKRHSFISPDGLIKEVHESLDRFRSELEDREKEQPDVSDDDQIRTELDTILTGRIGPPPTQEDLDEICKDGKRRYEDRLPPGFLDERKGKDTNPFSYSNGLRIDRKYGDLILWKQIIGIAKISSLKSIIFVTDDEKADWWWSVDSKGRKTIGARPELIEEIRHEAGVERFHVYNSERFLQFARKILGFAVKQSSIDEIGNVRQELASKDQGRFSEMAEEAVVSWLSELFDDQFLERRKTFPDIVLHGKDGQAGYEVKVVTARSVEHMSLELLNAHRAIPGLTEMCFILVARSQESVADIRDVLLRRLPQIPDDLNLVIGYLEFDTQDAKASFKGVYLESGTFTFPD